MQLHFLTFHLRFNSFFHVMTELLIFFIILLADSKTGVPEEPARDEQAERLGDGTIARRINACINPFLLETLQDFCCVVLANPMVCSADITRVSLISKLNIHFSVGLKCYVAYVSLNYDYIFYNVAFF